MRRRRDRAALMAGIALAILHVAVALLLAHSGGAPARPIYDGPCPPTTCTPCPALHCPTFTAQPYTPPPTAPPSSSSSRSSTSSGPTGSRTSSSSSSRSSSQSSTSAASSGAATGTSSAAAGASPQGQPSTGAPALPSHAVIGPEGGTLLSPGGELTVRIPAGALGEPVSLRILSASGIAPNPPAGRAAASQPWDVGGEGRDGPVTVFSKPVEISVRWTEVVPQFIEYWDGTAWVNLATTVDPGGHTATASVPHLTVFQAFGAPAAAADQGGASGRVLIAVGIGVAVALAAVAGLWARVLRRRPGVRR